LLSLDAKKSVEDSELRGRLDKRLKRVWLQIMPEAVVQIRSKIRETLERKIAGWVFDADTIRNYPFLVDLKLFVDSYVSCIKVLFDGNHIAVVVDPEKVLSFGLPENIYDLLEYGSSVFPQILHMREAMASWESTDGKLLMEKYIHTVSKAMNSEMI